MTKPGDSAQGIVGLMFANALIKGEFDSAYNLLSDSLKKELTPEKIKEQFNSMIEYGESPANFVEVMNILDEWQYPEQMGEDIGWAYIAIAGDGWSEAVSVIVTSENSENLIRYIEWGRP